jgi:hypothetical protein
MGLHIPFEYLKHKLWPKEGSGVKVSIWFPTIKSQESPWFTCVQVACHIPLERFWRGLQFYFRLHFNWRFAQKLWAFKVARILILGQNDILVQGLWLGIENIIKGKVVASPKFGPWWILWVRVCSWLVRAPKMFQPCTNQLVIWFVKVRVNNWPACHSS